MREDQGDTDAHHNECDGKKSLGVLIVVHERDKDKPGKTDNEKQWNAGHHKADKKEEWHS